MRRKLQCERKKRSWTQAHVAKRIGISARAYQHYERGDRTPSLEVANKLEDLFGISQRELLVRENSTTVSKVV